MQYTLGQACDRLADYRNAYGVTDLRVAVNAAVQALAGLGGWERLRKVVRFSSAGPSFALPQGCAGLVRACVNGHPVTVRGQDFQFLQSGPGDVVGHPPPGFELVPPRNVENLGSGPLVVEPATPFALAAFSDGENEPVLRVKAETSDGRIVRLVLPMHRPAQYASDGSLEYGCEPEEADFTRQDLTRVLEATLDANATKYVTLYARTDAGVERVALYHPSVRAPSFARYRIAGLPPDRPVEVLAEVRVDPLPLVDDSDVLPFPSVEPIEFMILYAWKMTSGEIDAARKYKEEAAGWLKAQEVVDDTVQTAIVHNVSVVGSMGELSVEAENI